MTRNLVYLFFCVALLLAAAIPVAADVPPGWEEVGTGSASGGGGISDNDSLSDWPSMAMAPDGTPYVSWRDTASGADEIYVRRWNGATWAEVGAPIDAQVTSSNPRTAWRSSSLAVAPDNTPYLAWPDTRSGDFEIYVRRWNGTSWEEVGTGSATSGGISDNAGDSWGPSLAVDPDGVPYVAWHDDSTGDTEIYVRRWKDATWEEVGTGSASGGGISDNSEGSGWPSLAVDSDGVPYVAWYDLSGGDAEIYVRRWDGSTWEEVGTGSASGGGISNNGGQSDYPSIAITTDGAPIIAWRDDSDGDREIYAKHWSGSAWQEMGTGSASGGGISDNSAASAWPSWGVAPDGTIYLTWHDHITADGNVEIYVLRWNGTTWEEVGAGSASGGGISNNSGDSWVPSSAIAPDGTPYIAWQDDSDGDSDIYARRWNGSIWEEVGAGSAGQSGISNNKGTSADPSLAVAPDGTPYLAWADDSSGDFEIYMRSWNGATWEEVGSGSASGGGISDNTGTSATPSLVIDADGVPYVAWHDDSDGDYEIYAKRWNGSGWDEVGTGSAVGGGISDNSGTSARASLAIDPDGTPYLAWHDDSDGDYEIYVKRWDGSSWQEIGASSATGGGISSNGSLSTMSSLAIAPDGTPYVVWEDAARGWDFKEIYVRRWIDDAWEEVGTGSASEGGISNDWYYSANASLSVAPDGMPIVAWYNYTAGGDFEIYARRWNGTAWVEVGANAASDGGISNNGGDSRNPSVAIASDSMPAVAWQDGSGGDQEVYVRRWDGSAWTEVGAGSASAGGISDNEGGSGNASAAVAPDGTLYVAWHDNSSGNWEIYLRRYLYQIYLPCLLKGAAP